MELLDFHLKLVLKFNDLFQLLTLVRLIIGCIGFILDQDIQNLMEIFVLLIALQVGLAERFRVLELLLIVFFALHLLLPDGHECFEVLNFHIKVWVVVLFLSIKVRKRRDDSDGEQGDQSLQEKRHLLVLVQVVHFVNEIFH